MLYFLYHEKEAAMTLKVIVKKIYILATTDIRYARLTAYITAITAILLISDIITISTGSAGTALPAVAKTIIIALGVSLLAEYKQRDPRLARIALPTWNIN